MMVWLSRVKFILYLRLGVDCFYIFFLGWIFGRVNRMKKEIEF